MMYGPQLSIGLVFLVQGVAERINEKEKHHTLEHRRDRGRNPC